MAKYVAQDFVGCYLRPKYCPQIVDDIVNVNGQKVGLGVEVQFVGGAAESLAGKQQRIVVSGVGDNYIVGVLLAHFTG